MTRVGLVTNISNRFDSTITIYRLVRRLFESVSIFKSPQIIDGIELGISSKHLSKLKKGNFIRMRWIVATHA